MRKNFPWLISRVFDPVIEIPILLTAAVWFALTNGMRWRFLIFLLIVDALVPAWYFVTGLKIKKYSDWDLTKREERYGLYFFTVFCHLFGATAAFFLGKIILFKILMVFWSLAVVFAFVTTFWKISVHGGVNGAIVAFFNHFYGWDNYWWLILILLAVLWSRVETKKHTWTQVILGAGGAIIWVSFGFKLLGV